MKQVSLFLLLFFSLSIMVAQGFDLEKTISELNIKIQQSQKGEKLKLLDSLTLLIRDRTEFKYDSVARVTIDFALELDSIKMATRNTADLIFYKCNIIGKPEEGLVVFKRFEGKEKGKGTDREAANLYLYGGDCYLAIGDMEAALNNYEKAKNFSLKSGDKKRLGVALLRMGFTHTETGLFAEASQSIQEASKLFYEVKDTIYMVDSKNALSILYSQNAFYEQAEKERNEAISLVKKMGAGGLLTSIYYNASADARMLGNNADRISYLKLAFEENEKSEFRNRLRPNILNNLVIAYAESDSISQAEKYLIEIESNPEDYTQGVNRDFYIEALKQVAFAKRDYTNALRYGREHLTLKKSQDSFVEIYNAEKFLADVYFEIGESDKANIHLNQYYSIKDSISSIQNVRTLTYYQTIYETEKRDLKIKAQDGDIALLETKNKVKNQWLLFGGLGLLGLFGIIILIRSRNTARRRQQLQEQFSQNLITAQEDERTRVARELHDSVGQKLMLLTKKTKDKNDPEMEALADSTLGELRSIARGLYPATLEKLGVTAAIQSMINEVDANTNIFFTNEIQNIDASLGKENSLHLYRIIQEALNNMVKHSEAKAAWITIQKKGSTIEAIIKDNGKGFITSDKLKQAVSLGMKTLHERAKIIKSKLNIQSEPGQGTTIFLQTPITHAS